MDFYVYAIAGDGKEILLATFRRDEDARGWAAIEHSQYHEPCPFTIIVTRGEIVAVHPRAI